MKNQDLENIRAVAPKFARWACVSKEGCGWWQNKRGIGGLWHMKKGFQYALMGPSIREFCGLTADGYAYAIDLKTGAIHVQHAGKIVVVSLAEWSAES